MALSKTLQRLTQFFLTTSCPLCQRNASQIFCPDCHRQLMECRWPSSNSGHAATLASHRPGANSRDLFIFSWGQYRGPLKQTLALLKYGNQTELGLWLGHQLGHHWNAHGRFKTKMQLPIVVPIPLHEDKLKQRGYNQAALIATGFCRVTGLPMAEHGLVRTKATEAMYGLGVTQRQANVTGAFQVSPTLKTRTLKARNRLILLVDDIYTTGSTARAAATTLKNAGYATTGITAMAQAVYSSPPDR